jgi:calpain family cysteine protease
VQQQQQRAQPDLQVEPAAPAVDDHVEAGKAQPAAALYGAMGGTGGDKAAQEVTENLGGTLWAKDDKGKDLPPSLDDISQGGLNDCYVFAAMASIVHANPGLINHMIKDNGNGTYTVTFAGTGIFSADDQTVSADLVKGKHGNMQGRKALWPLIIEKAYAQEKGGIAKLDTGGNSGSAVDDFVNQSASRFDPRGKEVAWILAKLAKAQADHKPTTILSPKKDDATKDKKEMSDKIPGLHFWHFYAILEVDEKAQRVKLFNPWGHDHPNGDGWIGINDLRTFFIEVDING